MKAHLFAVAALIALSLAAVAAPGDIDTAYGLGGVAGFRDPQSAFPLDFDFTPDGGIVAGGNAAVIAKFTAGGGLDGAFGTGGMLLREGRSIFHRIVGVRTLASGRIQVAEELDDPCVGSPFFCAVQSYGDLRSYRLIANGARDPAYGSGTESRVADAEGPAMVMLSTGEVITFAFVRQLNADPVFKMVALDRDGLRDPGYESRATVALACGAPYRAMPAAPGAAVASGVKTIVATRIVVEGVPGSNRICVSRLNADGSLDTAFGEGGHVIVNPPTQLHEPFRVLVRSDGRLLVALAQPVTFNTISGSGNPAFVWLTAAGALDPTLADLGVTYPTVVPLGLIADMALQPDDKVLAVGYSSTAPGVPQDTTRPRLVRMDTRGGVLDFGFGPFRGGYVDLVTAAGQLDPKRLRAGPTGGIFVAGGFIPAGATQPDFAVMKVKDVEPQTQPPGNDGGGGGGGCGSTTKLGPMDPTLPALVLLAWLALLGRRRPR